MKNYWLKDKFIVGARVKYIGPDKNLKNQIGLILKVWEKSEWFEVFFPDAYKPPHSKPISVEKGSLELFNE